jgi:hypothetical protein
MGSFETCSRKKFLKGQSPLISAGFVFLMVIIATGIVLVSGNKVLNFSKTSSAFNDAKNAMSAIENTIKEVAEEGEGAKKALKISYPGTFESLPGENSVEFSIVSDSGFLNHFSRTFRANLVTIAGDDVSCDNIGNLTLENSFIKAELLNVPVVSAIDTSGIILSITEKTGNSQINFVNSSIQINDNITTMNGTGYSEITRTGKNLPLCQAHFFINSTKSYDIYYKLYAGSDFLVIDVRNVK